MEVETLTQEIGRKLYQLVKKETPFFSSWWLKEKLICALMKNEELRGRLLSFVDVFASLKDQKEISSHFKEYFPSFEKLNFPCFDWLISFFSAKAIEQTAKFFILPQQFFLLKEKLRTLQSQGFSFTLDLLGETVFSEKEAEDYLSRYLLLINLLSLSFFPVDISLKLTSLASQLDPLNTLSQERVYQRLRKIFRLLQFTRGELTLDMERYYLRDLTLDIFKEILEEFPEFDRAGIAIQCYLKDTPQNLEDLLGFLKKKERKIKIRLVKGAYWDQEVALARDKNWEVPVFEKKSETDLCFEEMAQKLILDPQLILASGTHNLRSIAKVMALQKVGNLPLNKVEFQVLYGMGNPLAKAILKLGFSVKFYLPSGQLLPGMAYLVRRLIENSSQSGFLFQTLTGKKIDELLKNPREVK